MVTDGRIPCDKLVCRKDKKRAIHVGQGTSGKKWITLVAGLLALLAVGWFIWRFMPFFNSLMDPQFRVKIQEWIDSVGYWGLLFLLCLQVLQIIVAFIPGEPVELLAGLLYGTWGGLAVCLVGVVIGEAAVFGFSRRFGHKLHEKLFSKKKLEEYRFLNTTEKVETVVFLLFLIPGTPKDLLTYLVGITPIQMKAFLILSTLARIPSVVTSTWMGSTVSQGQWGMTGIVFLLTAAIGILGIFLKDQLMNMFQRPKK